MDLDIGAVFIFFTLLWLFLYLSKINEDTAPADPLLLKIKSDLKKVFPQDVKIYSSNNSYTYDKSKIYLLLRDENGEYYDYNTLMYAAIHELTHIICPVVDSTKNHSEEFQRTFRQLLSKAEATGIWKSSLSVNKDYCSKCVM